MSPTYHALDILCRVGTPRRRQILAGMPATREDYAIHGAWYVNEIEYQTDKGEPAKAARAKAAAKRALKAAADLGDTEAGALLAMLA